MDLSALPASGAVLNGGLFLFFTLWANLAIFDRLNAAGLLPLRLPPLGSVGLSAVAIARLLSSGTIIVAGLDFSFTLDSYHARSTPGHKRRLNTLNRFSSLLNVDAAFGDAANSSSSKSGGKVFTGPALRKYRDLFEREFAHNPRIFDLSGELSFGLPLGIPALSFEDTLKLLSSGDCKAVGRQAAGQQVAGQQTAAGQQVVEADCLPVSSGESAELKEKLAAFTHAELKRLLLLKDMLTGAIPMNYETLDMLIDECDYLWAHFPDYAASGKRPTAFGGTAFGDTARGGTAGAEQVSFLKRVRVEIDPFVRLWGIKNGECPAD
jgi:hypothetical protein